MLKLTGIYCAGNQNDFTSEDPIQNDANIRKYGCGLIGLADILLYLGADPGNTYPDFVRLLDRAFVRVHGMLGINGLNLAHGFNSYAKLHDISFSAHWGIADEDFLPAVRFMLKNNIPVILSVGPNMNPGEKMPGVPVYGDIEKTRPQGARICDHYVTVTGIAEADGKTMLKFFSWGKEYYMDFKDYLSYRKNQPPVLGSMASNILCVRPLNRQL